MKIITHNAKFHTDDIFAVAALFLLLGEENCEVIRTRDPDIISSGDYVVDVGNMYDPERRLFDHHQNGGAADRDNGIPYASFGLVWKEFGEKISGSSEVALIIDQKLVQPVDAGDNGKETYTPTIPNIYPFTLNSIIDSYRPTWKEEDNWEARFLEAVSWAKSVLKRQIKVAADNVEGTRIISKAYEKAPDKRLIILTEEESFSRELVTATLSNFPEPLYAVYYREDANEWQLVAIRSEQGSFELRKPLPLAWAGKRDGELEEATGVEGAVFCHRGRFMCLTHSKESALKLAMIALNS